MRDRNEVYLQTVLSFWGKTARDQAGTKWDFKPVLHHLLDVAAVALRLQLASPARLHRQTATFGIDPNRFARLAAYLAGLHDLGKFSVSFQAKVERLWPGVVLGPYTGRVPDRGHWRNTAAMLRWNKMERLLESLFPELISGHGIFAASIAGHHGRPPEWEDYNYDRYNFSRDPELSEPCLDAAYEAMLILQKLVAPRPVPEISEPEQAQMLSWHLAGLTTVADWVGSDINFFPFEDPAMPVLDYWELVLERAERAIAEKGLRPQPVRNGIGFDGLVSGAAPRPMQAEADRLPLREGAQLIIIEDATGSGKTEAALTLAARMMACGNGEGIYFALPTMATANAMFRRLGDLHKRLFADGAKLSLVLAHGRSMFDRNLLGTRSIAGNGGEEDNAAWCAEWIADDRRKAFFADIGAGTIDQAFLAVLKKKHLTLRQYGLAGRILIVDEAHAFDAYMGHELETLLEMHAAHGGSAIVLSATLPAQKRRMIVNAFRKGLGCRQDEDLLSGAYPLLTVASRDRSAENEVRFCEELRRTVTIERLPNADAASSRALAAARTGAAVLVIRNAVDEAISTFRTLRAAYEQTSLFHARFAMCDRQRIEEGVLSRFGRDAGRERRAGQILVATQVVEQSLDLDFDLVISDLAPIDLLIQRAGRLWRHMNQRPSSSRSVHGPTLCVISPAPSEATQANWLEPVLGRGAFVYDDPGIMWRTAKTIFSAGAIRTPEDLRPFIERVYGSREVPPCLERGQDLAEGKGHGERFQAGQNLIRFTEGYPKMGNPADDQEVGTRLGEETVTLRLACICGGKLVPWAQALVDQSKIPRDHDVGEMSAWALSEISVRRKWLGQATEAVELAPLIEVAKARWPGWERNTILLGAVTENGLVRVNTGGSRVEYDRAVGLTKA